jgi:hypothetical protein
VNGINALPGGRLHRFDSSRWDAIPILTPAEVTPRRSSRQQRPVAEVARALVRTATTARQSVEPLSCTLTGGRDTRVLVGVALAAGWNASYYTSGQPSDVDVQFAGRIAGRLGLSHRVVTPRIPADLTGWMAATSRFVAQTDGMATLYLISDWLDHQQPVRRLGLELWGAGGEIGRAVQIGVAMPFAANFPGLRATVTAQRAMIRRKTSDWGGLLRPEARRLTLDSLDAFIDERLEEGWRAREVFEAYYAFERVPHWAAMGVRRAAAATDLHSPFISRDFITYCYSLSSGERIVEASHWRLLGELSPGLREIPFEHPWPAQRPEWASAMIVADVARLGLSRLRRRRSKAPSTPDFGWRWLEAGREAVRDLVSSAPDSGLWDLVDRRELERALSGPSEHRAPRSLGLSAIATVLWYLHGPEPPGGLSSR